MTYGAMQTGDGQWRVEIIRKPNSLADFWYRLTHGDNVIDWLTIGGVEHILAEAGVDMADLIPAVADQTSHGRRSPGAA